MVKLLPVKAFGDQLPREIGEIAMTEVTLDVVYAVAPFAGQTKATSAAIKDQIGLGLSAVGRSTSGSAARVIWFGHQTWLVTSKVALDGLAAVTDQSDAFAILRIAGAGVEDVLARLVPVDLRAHVFKPGHTAKTMLNHMSVTITRIDAQAFEIMAMRSMAGTLVHELDVAARSIAQSRSNF